MGKSGTNGATREGVRTQQPQVLFAGLGDAVLTPPAHGRRLDLADAGNSQRPAQCVDDSVRFVDSSVHGPILGEPNGERNRPGEHFSEYASGMNDLSERLRWAMAQAGITKQVQLAKEARVRPPSVNDWLSGKTKTMAGKNLLRVASYLKVDPQWLATGRGSPHHGSGEGTVNESTFAGGIASQSVRLDPAILVESENWALLLRQAEGGDPKDDLRKMELLAEVYEQIVMDGGRLSGEHHHELFRRASQSSRGEHEQSRERGGAEGERNPVPTSRS